jgi:Uncharacterized conserved protein
MTDNLREIYDKIKKDPEWNNWMDTIEAFSDGNHESTKYMCDHGRLHADNVQKYAVKFLCQIGGGDAQNREIATICALLHDIGLVHGESNHAKTSEKMTKVYLEKFNLDNATREIILHAISDHSNGDSVKDLVGAAILLGDKMDVASDRIISGIELNYLCQNLKKVQKVEFTISDKIAYLDYAVEDGFDHSSLADWKKCITAPEKVASFLNKDFIFRINGNEVPINDILR